MVPRYLSAAPCSLCGHMTRAINPAWLQVKRTQAKLSLKRFGMGIGRSPQYLNDIEHGRRRCPKWIEVAYARLRPCDVQRSPA
jgi:hypothetical protein